MLTLYLRTIFDLEEDQYIRAYMPNVSNELTLLVECI